MGEKQNIMIVGGVVASLGASISVYIDSESHHTPFVSQPVEASQFNTGRDKKAKESIQENPMSKKVLIYTTQVCPYCVKAKKLFDSKGIAYEEIDVGNNHDARLTMIERSGGKTSVPQIFIGDTHVGGADDLYALHGKGELDSLLAK